MEKSKIITNRDNLFSRPLSTSEKFEFNDAVANVFPDMINRSVPGYSSIIAMIEILAGMYVRENSCCYDLGCSLGAATKAIIAGTKGKNCKVIAVDKSPAMVERCRYLFESGAYSLEETDYCLKVLCTDIKDVLISNASVVVSNFTLQFIEQESRLAILSGIYQGMCDGGILILSEKIKFGNPLINESFIQMHHSFKRSKGYSELEISQKRMALEKVLVPETPEKHRIRLAEAGFRNSTVWFQCFNFISIIAWK